VADVGADLTPQGYPTAAVTVQRESSIVNKITKPSKSLHASDFGSLVLEPSKADCPCPWDCMLHCWIQSDYLRE